MVTEAGPKERKNLVQDYEDVDLHNTFYKKGSVSRIVTGEEVMNVIGQLKRV